VTRLRRHDLAYLSDAAALRPVGDATHSPAVHAWLFEWIASGQPLVVARQSSLPSDSIQLGAALPLRLGRAKMACATDGSPVRIAPALAVEKVLGVLPARDRRTLARLAELAQALGIAVGVYGSTAWECLSGERYRRCDSDVDLICDVSRRDALSPWLRAMESAARDMDDHLDGEIRFPDGQAVAWRELARATDGERVLVKSLHNVGFARVGALMESLR
jgi:phosphoribosyl-dephospho-CoA transferase